MSLLNVKNSAFAKFLKRHDFFALDRPNRQVMRIRTVSLIHVFECMRTKTLNMKHMRLYIVNTSLHQQKSFQFILYYHYILHFAGSQLSSYVL